MRAALAVAVPLTAGVLASVGTWCGLRWLDRRARTARQRGGGR